jgi:hypothetical protein
MGWQAASGRFAESLEETATPYPSRVTVVVIAATESFAPTYRAGLRGPVAMVNLPEIGPGDGPRCPERVAASSSASSDRLDSIPLASRDRVCIVLGSPPIQIQTLGPDVSDVWFGRPSLRGRLATSGTDERRDIASSASDDISTRVTYHGE